MSKINISFICPIYYGGLEYFLKSMDSIFTNTFNLDRIEVLLRLDTGDDQTLKVVDKYISDNKNYNIRKIIGERFRYQDNHIYFNELAALSEGDLIFPWAGDCFIETKNWDVLLEEFFDKPVIVKPIIHHIRDIGTAIERRKTPKTNITPITNRLIYNALGHMAPCPAIDSWLSNLSARVNIEKKIDLEIGNIYEKNKYRKHVRNLYLKSLYLLDVDCAKVKKMIKKLGN